MRLWIKPFSKIAVCKQHTSEMLTGTGTEPRRGEGRSMHMAHE